MKKLEIGMVIEQESNYIQTMPHNGSIKDYIVIKDIKKIKRKHGITFHYIIDLYLYRENAYQYEKTEFSYQHMKEILLRYGTKFLDKNTFELKFIKTVLEA